MIEEAWRPLGIDTEEQIAEYDALHDGVPKWMASSFWVWVRDALTVRRRYRDGSGPVPMLNTDLAERMCQTLKIPIPDLRASGVSGQVGERQLLTAITTLQKHAAPLQIADYLLAHDSHASAEDLGAVLVRSKSAYEIGVRAGRPA
ncbi:hypothetical protein ABZ403_02885 [Micromonospora zamorensis]|uniref:hypothetical protein n=1 Tax=Micromonospora zamorensis TaxID=709883 RepID=UPI0034020C21